MTNEEQFLHKALARVKELQQETIEKSKQIEGSEEYVAKRLELFRQNEELIRKAEELEKEETRLREEFFAKIEKPQSEAV